MKADQLYDYLLQAAARNAALVLTFDDGDKYNLATVDLCYSVGRDGERDIEPLCVSFESCLNDSNKHLQALRDGELNTPGVLCESTKPATPVGMWYGVENVVTIWDDAKNYVVYHRDHVA